MSRKALGRGLEALIPGGGAAIGLAGDDARATPELRAPGIRELPVEDIGPNPFQPRQRFDDAAMKELADSIRASGVLQPVIVRRAESGFQLVVGERRLRASQLAGLARIPAVVREVDDRQMMELALIENIQRENLNPIEEAKAYLTLVEKVGLTHDQVSERVGKQRSSITNSLRLLGLPVEVQDMVSRGTITAGHARALLSLEGAGDQLACARYVVNKGFSVRRTEIFVKRKLKREHSRPHVARVNGMTEWQEKLQSRFGTRVSIVPGRKGGRVEFEYYSQDDLERLFEAWGVL